MKNLVLIDGNHMMHRAYWAIPRTLKTNAGEQINTVFGMASMLMNIIVSERPDGILICFDAGSETFRHQENETYKDGRAQTPDDFYVQVPRILELIRTFDIADISEPRLEADDLLAIYATAYAKQGAQVTIVSGDRDLFQLASDSIRIAIPHKGYQAVEYLDHTGVFGKIGVTPQQIACYKGLCGDSSDNLPGVPGIGPKTAVTLLTEYGTLENIYDHLEDIKPTVRLKLEQNKESAFFCKRMATLITDEPMVKTVEELETGVYPVESLQKLFEELQFTLLIKRLALLNQKEKFRLQSSQKSDSDQTKSEENLSDDQLSLF